MKKSDFRDLVENLEQAALHASGVDVPGLRVHVRERPAKKESEIEDGAAKPNDRPDWTAFDRIMSREGGEPPQPGDEIPQGYRRTRK
jgi:hypothetical protein